MTIKKENFEKLKANYKTYLPDAEKAMDKFGNEALCFHKCTLQIQKKDFLSDSHLKQIYETLKMWGMDKKGAKLECEKIFSKSIIDVLKKSNAQELLNLKIEELEDQDFEDKLETLTTICFELKASVKMTKIVAATKTLAHIFPNLVPPMDRKYTMNFFGCHWDYITEPKKKLERQKEIFRAIMRAMRDFYSDKNIVAAAKELVKNNKKANTSLPKIFDNLIITYMNEHKNK